VVFTDLAGLLSSFSNGSSNTWKLSTFMGMSETAIQNQIFLALITYCLHVLIQLEMKIKKSLLRITRWLKRALWKPAFVWLRKFDGRASP